MAFFFSTVISNFATKALFSLFILVLIIVNLKENKIRIDCTRISKNVFFIYKEGKITFYRSQETEYERKR